MEGEAPVFETLQVFRMADAMARHASVRQTVIAGNMANADTPGYKAQDIASFSETIDTSAPGFGLKATRSAHLNGSPASMAGRADQLGLHEEENPWSSPNGNSVSLEEQVMKSVQVKQQHDKALAIYKSALDVMRTALGRR